MHAELFDMNQLVCRGFIANPVQAETATLQPCWQIPNAWEGHAAMAMCVPTLIPASSSPQRWSRLMRCSQIGSLGLILVRGWLIEYTVYEWGVYHW